MSITTSMFVVIFFYLSLLAFLAFMAVNSKGSSKRASKTPTASSPNRKKLSELTTLKKDARTRNNIYNFVCEALRGSITVYGANRGNDPGTDPFLRPLLDAIDRGEFLTNHGVICHMFRRDPVTGGAIQNSNNPFFRVWIVQFDAS